jgi:hypothetical protein
MPPGEISSVKPMVSARPTPYLSLSLFLYRLADLFSIIARPHPFSDDVGTFPHGCHQALKDNDCKDQIGGREERDITFCDKQDSCRKNITI